MQVRVLGEVEVVEDAPIALGGPIQRRMLAALAIRRGEVVSVSWLADVVWPDGTGPARAEHNIRTYVHRLRAALGDEGVRIETVGSGYRLRLNVEELDAAHFEWLADAAATRRTAATRSGRSSTSAEPSRLWLGTPLEEFEHEPWATPAVVRLRERRANLRERRAAALIEVGRPTEAIEVLDPLVRDEPLRERPRALLMRALYEAGRQPEALRVFQEFRTYLAGRDRRRTVERPRRAGQIDCVRQSPRDAAGRPPVEWVPTICTNRSAPVRSRSSIAQPSRHWAARSRSRSSVPSSPTSPSSSAGSRPRRRWSLGSSTPTSCRSTTIGANPTAPCSRCDG